MHLLSSEMATLRGRWRAVLMRHLGDRVRGEFSAQNVVLYITVHTSVGHHGVGVHDYRFGMIWTCCELDNIRKGCMFLG